MLIGGIPTDSAVSIGRGHDTAWQTHTVADGEVTSITELSEGLAGVRPQEGTPAWQLCRRSEGTGAL